MTGISLDPLTLLFCIAVMAFQMGFVSFTMAAGLTRHDLGLKEWGTAMMLAGAAFMLFVLRGQAPWFATFGVANALVMTFPAIGVLGLARLLQSPPPRVALAMAWIVGFSGVLIHTAFGTDLRWTIFSLSTGVSALMSTGVLLIVRGHQPRLTRSSWMMAGMLGMASLAFAMRAVVSLVGDSASVALAVNTRPQVGSLLLGAVYIVGASLGFFFMVQDRQRSEAKALAQLDQLTGVCTRAGFFELAEAIDADPASRYAIVMLDIDHFKRINDAHGHSGGDVALAQMASVVAGTVRSTDLVGRYGGEEFCVLLRDCGEPAAAQFAQRLVRAASDRVMYLGDGTPLRLTVSAGHACRGVSAQPSGGPERLAEVIERADCALYAAKHGGRNQAVAAEPVVTRS